MGKIIRINQIKLPVGHDNHALDLGVKRALKLSHVPEYRIVKKSIDARDKDNLLYIYSVEVSADTLTDKQKSGFGKNKNIVFTENTAYSFGYQVECLKEKYGSAKQLRVPPVIVGTGPAGLFCGYQLAKAGYQPILIERGSDVETRVRQIEDYWNGAPLNESCNVQFGEGGAGTFSDGKLNTMIKDKNKRIEQVLETFVAYGADSDILYVNKPHIGTDVLRDVVKQMRKAIIELGGQVHFDTCLTDITYRGKDSVIETITIVKDGMEQIIPCECLILALGHSSRDTFTMLHKKSFYITPKAFAVGLRIEHPADMIQKSQYGSSDAAGKLPAADYKLTHQTEEGRGVYSFCMCPGGHIVDASSEKERIAVNGMSYRKRDAMNSNSAIVVNVNPEDFVRDMKGAEAGNPLLGIEFQRKWEHAAYMSGQGRVPLQLFGDYMRNKTTTGIGAVTPDIKGQYAYANLNDCLPDFVNNAIIKGIMSFDHRIHGFAREDAVLCGIESRTSSPIRIERNDEFQSNIKGLFPCGEGAGYAGGITSAAVDGIKVAEAVAASFVPAYE